MKRIRISGVTLVFVLLWWIANAHASAVMYTDQAAWMAKVLESEYSVTNIDFEQTTISSDFLSVTAGDVIFTSHIWLEVGDGYGIPYNAGKVLYPTHNQSIDVKLPPHVYAFGFDLGELEPILGYTSTATLSNVVLSTGDVFAGPYPGNPYPTFAFFGFFSDLPVTSLSMHPHALVEAILDNFSYAQAAVPAPEPTSLLLFCSGIIGIAAHRWRGRHR